MTNNNNIVRDAESIRGKIRDGFADFPHCWNSQEKRTNLKYDDTVINIFREIASQYQASYTEYRQRGKGNEIRISKGNRAPFTRPQK